MKKFKPREEVESGRAAAPSHPLPRPRSQLSAPPVKKKSAADGAAAPPATPKPPPRPAKPLEVPAGAKLVVVRDSLIKGMERGLRAKFGTAYVPTAQHAHQFDMVVPAPLVLQHVMGISGWPCGRVMEITAQQSSGKTALLSYIGRCFEEHEGGIFGFVNNEDKYDEEWVSSFGAAPVRVDADTSNAAIALTRAMIENYIHQQYYPRGQKQRRPRKLIRCGPLVVGVDSLMGHQSEEVAEKIVGARDDKSGERSGGGEAVSRAFPVEAGQMAKFFRTIGTTLVGWPIMLVAVNQLRLKTVEGSYVPIKEKAGGAQINFAKSFEFELYSQGAFQTSRFEGKRVRIKLGKSSGASDQRWADVQLRWWYEESEAEANPDGSPKLVKRAEWAWDWATVRLLLTLQSSESNLPYYRSRLKEYECHVDAPSQGDTDNLAWSRMLGMRNEKQAIPWAELGRALVENPETLARLRKALGVLVRPVVTQDYASLFDRTVVKGAIGGGKKKKGGKKGGGKDDKK